MGKVALNLNPNMEHENQKHNMKSSSPKMKFKWNISW
jgi:hypothetical protein